MSKLTVTATGDSLYCADMPKEYDSDLSEIANYIGQGQIKITNLEANVEEFGDYANAYSGGTWVNVEPKDFDYLTKYGFNYYGTANNHVMDYGYHGLFSTIAELDKRGLAHSGSGESLKKASEPAIIEVEGLKVGIIAVCTTFNEGSKAGNPTPYIKARPGVNYVGYQRYYQVDKEDIELLKKVAEKSKVNAYEELMVEEGFSKGDAKGVYSFGKQKFCYDKSKKSSECIKGDKERFIKSIKQAKEFCDYLFVLTHCHEIGDKGHEDLPDFIIELAHEAIDAGANAIIGGGTHRLRPVEIYNGAPIFYSLGDFTYQGMRVKYLPADFLNKYGLEDDATAYEGLMARSEGGKKGLQTQECNFLTVIPKMQFEEGKLKSLQLKPVSLGFNRRGDLNGLPYLAKGEESQKIFNVLKRLSTPMGTKITMKEDVIDVQI